MHESCCDCINELALVQGLARTNRPNAPVPARCYLIGRALRQGNRREPTASKGRFDRVWPTEPLTSPPADHVA